MDTWLAMKKEMVYLILFVSAFPVSILQRNILMFIIFVFVFSLGAEAQLQNKIVLKKYCVFSGAFLLTYFIYFLLRYVRYGAKSFEWVGLQYWGELFWSGSAFSLCIGILIASIVYHLINGKRSHFFSYIIIESVFVYIGFFVTNLNIFRCCFFISCCVFVFIFGSSAKTIMSQQYFILKCLNIIFLVMITSLSTFRNYYVFFYVTLFLVLLFILILSKIINKTECLKIKYLLKKYDITEDFVLILGMFVFQSSLWSRLGFNESNGMIYIIGIFARLFTLLGILILLKYVQKKCVKDFKKFTACVYFLLTPAISMFLTEVTYNGTWHEIYLIPGLINLFLYIGIFLITSALVGNCCSIIIINYIISFLWGLLNSYLIRFKNSPFIPGDLLAAKTGLSVMTQYDYSFDKQNYFGLLMLVIVIIFALFFSKNIQMLFKGLYKRLIIIIMTITTYSLVFTFFSGEQFVVKDAYFWWLPQNTYYHNGSLFSFMVYSQLLKVRIPDGYTSEKADAILARYENQESDFTDGINPNLIVIMNEAYSDLRVVGDFSVTDEYMPYWNSLNENVIRGNMYVSAYGNYTANTEFEFLTGNSMAFYPNDSVPYQQYVSKPIKNGLVSLLNEYDYVCHAIHPYGRTGWNRPRVYDYMGFQDYISEESFENPLYVRNLISDTSSYRKDIELFENRDSNRPFFAFNVTVQNHGGYWEETIPDHGIYINGLSRKYKNVENYLSLIKESDNALKELIEYFKAIDEPTVIVMFGDHQPGIDNLFYEEVSQKPIGDWGLADWQKKYQVPYFIWANYDIGTDNIDISTNYLFPMILRVMGLEGNSYTKFLQNVQQYVPILNANGYMDSLGNWYEIDNSNIPKEMEQWINDYKFVQYRIMFD